MMVGNHSRHARWSGLLVLVALTATSLVAGPTSGAVAEEVEPILASIEFELDGFQDMQLVEATDRLFVTGGATNDTLLVVDLDGNEIKRFTGLNDVRQLALDSVSGWVWMAESGAHAVRAYDSETGVFQKKVDLPAAMCPSPVALAGVSDAAEGNESLIVGSECDDTLVVVDLSDFTWDDYSGFPGVIQLSESPPPEQPGRFVMLDATGVTVMRLGTPPNALNPTYEVDAVAMETSYKGGRSVAVATASDVRILNYPNPELTDTFSGLPPTIAIAWTSQPAVVAVNLDDVLGLKPSAAGAIWSFPVGDAIPYPNGIQAHSDGRIFVAAKLPDAPGDPGGGGGGGGGTGVIVPVEDEDPASLSGTVSAALPAAAGHTPSSLEVRLVNGDGDVVGTDTVAWGTDYSFTTVQPGTYYLEFHALSNGDAEGFFPERYSDKPYLSKDAATDVVLTDGKETVVDATLQPLFYDMYDSIFYGDILWMGNTAITRGCNPPDNTLYCVGNNVTRGQMAAFLVRALGLTDPGTTDFTDDNGSIFEGDIEKLAAAGITKGCNPPDNTKFCPGDRVTRGQMAAFLNRALADLWPSG